MSSKPSRGKRLNRMHQKKQKKEDRLLELAFLKRPKHLKGKAIGLWHRDRKRQLDEMKKAAGMYDVKMTKKQNKELKRLNRLRKLEVLSDCFKISFDPDRRRMIEDYLNSAAKTSPTFLIPLNKYHTKVKQDSDIQEEDHVIDVNDAEKTVETEIDVDHVLLKVKQLQNDFPCEKGLSLSQIKSFLKAKDKSYTSDNSPLNHNSGSAGDSASVITEDDGCFDSIDKYKHLEDTPFKKKFLSTLSQSIYTNLDKALKNTALRRDKTFDNEMYQNWKMKESNSRFQLMSAFRRKLPAYNMRQHILDLVTKNQVILISGETGCGKTTQIAQFILDNAMKNHNGSVCNIICTQPRRISAISVAQRVSDERVEALGKESVGYHIRLEKKIGRNRCAILFCTTGILLQYMQSNPALKRYSHIILDEIHERDTLCDFAMTLLKDVAAKRKDLKIILMSATLNAEQFSYYFNDCPSVNIPGYTFPVTEMYLEDILELTSFKFPPSKKEADDENFRESVLPYIQILEEHQTYSQHVIESLKNPDSEKTNAGLIVTLMKYICNELGDGAILVFVPGWEDINAIVRTINNEANFFTPSKFITIPLHSMLPSAHQQSVFDRPPPGVRKIVIATNIAETSITIDDVVFVIDCGKIKIKNYDVANNISTLNPEFVSLANARQRKGRAGRVQPGYCFHLFSRGREMVLDDYPVPEIMRTRLEEVILNIKLLMLGKAEPFLRKVMSPPDLKTVVVSLELLRQLDALDENENLTPLGFHLAKLPLDPQIGKMLLLGVIMSCLNPILSIAAALSFKDPFYLPLGEEKNLKERKLELDKKRKSDHLILAEIMSQWDDLRNRDAKEFCLKNYLTRGTLYQLRDLKAQFAQYLCEMGFLKSTNYKSENLNMNTDNYALIKAVICAGLYPNVAIIKKKTKQGVLLKTSEDNVTVRLHPKSVNAVQTSQFETKFMVYHEKLKSSSIFVYDSTMVSSLPLLIHCSDFFITYPKKKKAIIHINKNLVFACDTHTAHYITELKLRLNWLLEYKLSHPGEVTWKDSSSEIELLRILTNLFTIENDDVMRQNEDSSEETQQLIL